MVYVDTPRLLWRRGRTMLLFLGTVALGTAATIAARPAPGLPSQLLLAVLLAVKLVAEWVPVLRASDLGQTRRQLFGPLRTETMLRLLAAAVVPGLAIVLPQLSAIAPPEAVLSIVLLALLCSEILERLLFFRSVIAPRMPGWEVHT